MKISIRPLQRGKAAFTVEAEPSETISELKLKINAKQGFPVESQNILVSGKSLQDDKSIASYNIKDASTLILMLKGAPAGPVGSGATNSPRTAPTSLNSAPRPPTLAPTAAPTRSIPTGPGPAFGGPGMPSNVAVSQANIDKIMGMGMDFTKEQVVRALRASFDNPDQAVEFLFNGIPDVSGNGPGSNAAPQMSNLLGNLPNLMSGTGPSGSAPGLPQNMLQSMMQQQPQRQQLARRDASAMSMGGPGGLGGMGALGAMGGGMGGMGGDGGGDGTPVEIDPAQVQAIRRMVAENPALTGPLIKSLKETDPEGAARLTPSDPDGILQYFSEIGNEDGPSDDNGALARLPAPPRAPAPGRAPSPPGTQVAVTPEEHASIQKLEAMGYPRNAVIQAFLACGKNEELAASFLVEGGFDD